MLRYIHYTVQAASKTKYYSLSVYRERCCNTVHLMYCVQACILRISMLSPNTRST